MDASALQARLALGGARTAARIGSATDCFRPKALLDPFQFTNLYQRIPVTFLPEHGKADRAVPDTQPFWRGVFDTSATWPGDILRRVSDHATWFIASKQLGLPVMCIRCTRVIDITRPATASSAGLNAYGGTVVAADTMLAQSWPARFLASGISNTANYGISGELPTGSFQVLLPVSLKLGLHNGDILTDDLGRNTIVATAELTDQCWRLMVQQAP